MVQASTCVEDVVKAILQKSLGLLWSTLDHHVAVLQRDDLITHVCSSAVSHTRLRTQTYLGQILGDELRQQTLCGWGHL